METVFGSAATAFDVEATRQHARDEAERAISKRAEHAEGNKGGSVEHAEGR